MLKPLHLFLGVLTTFLWGFNFVVIKVGLQGMPPIFFCFLRFLFTAFPLVFFLPRPEVAFHKVIAYGFLIFACQFAFLITGMHFGVSAGLASIVLQMQAFLTIGLSVVLLRERMLKSQLAGALVAFGGVVLIGAQTGGEVSVLGLVLLLLAACSWAGGNIVARSIGTVNILSLVVWGSLVAVLPLGLMSFVLEGKDVVFTAMQHMDWLFAATIFYQAYFATIIGYAVWSGLLMRYPASSVAPLSLLVPVFGLSNAAFFLGEPLPLWKIGAAVLVLLGLCINLFGPRLRARKIA